MLFRGVSGNTHSHQTKEALPMKSIQQTRNEFFSLMADNGFESTGSADYDGNVIFVMLFAASSCIFAEIAVMAVAFSSPMVASAVLALVMAAS